MPVEVKVCENSLKVNWHSLFKGPTGKLVKKLCIQTLHPSNSTFRNLPCRYTGALVAQTVKHLPAMRETQVQFLGREDPLEKEMAIHSSTLAWKIPWMEEPDRLQSMGSQSRTRLSDFTFTSLINIFVKILLYLLILKTLKVVC